MAGEKTEKATPKKKQDERKKGNVFMSKEVLSIGMLFAIFASFQLLFPSVIGNLTNFIEKYIVRGLEITELNAQNLRTFLIDGIIVYILVAIPFLLVSILVSVILTFAQTKMLVSSKAFEFKGERINPLSGFKRMFSARGLVELLKSIIKIGVLIYIFYTVISDEINTMPNMFYMEPIQAYAFTGTVIIRIAFTAGAVYLVIGGLDYLYQWWDYEKKLKMTKQEVKDEYKQIEGDPQIKAHIRSLQQQRARQRMMQNVPEADVVIRNPTHYAVAIKYDAEKNGAPIVVAKGMDSLALRIIKVAEENDVYVTEDRPLARALYDGVELYREVPPEFYRPIAEILGFIYRLRKKD